MTKKFLIIDGYPKEERDRFKSVGMTLAGELYKKLLLEAIPDAFTEIVYTSDSNEKLSSDFISAFDGVLWPGCNLSVLNVDWRVQKMFDICDLAFQNGIPQFGSCWAAQVAVTVGGGKVVENPKGREMVFARKIEVSNDGKNHPMYKMKPQCFDAFSSHDDHISSINSDTTKILSTNDFSGPQAIVVKIGKGEFWATQYHPEYNFAEMAYLLKAREKKMLDSKFFNSIEELIKYSEDLISIFHDRSLKNLNWKYGIDETILDDKIKNLEFFAWVRHFYNKN